MTEICLIRHGETDWNSKGRLQGREDIELNDRGREQARVCGLFLKKQQWDIIASSPLKRAKETSSIIGEYLGIYDIMEMEAFIERDFGSGSGLTREEIEKKFKVLMVPDAELFESVQERTLNGLKELVGQFADKKIIVVAHGGVINSILATLSNGEIGTGKTRLKNVCLNYITYQEGEWELKGYNLTPHLE
jgi:uncharacterized phosphatase